MPLEIRQLIREMSLANPLWGAPRIHGELLKLGISVGQTSVAKYLARRRRPPSQGWGTFLRNHAGGIARCRRSVRRRTTSCTGSLASLPGNEGRARVLDGESAGPFLYEECSGGNRRGSYCAGPFTST